MNGIQVPMSRGAMEDIAEEVEPSSSQMDTGESMTTQGARNIYQREALIVVDYSSLDEDYKDVMSFAIS